MTEHDNGPASPTSDSGGVADNELPGRVLREEREARGLSIRQAASELHVGSLLLDALENDDFERIGAPIFVKGHLRNYARLLGLDPQPLVDAYEQKAAGDPPDIVTRQTDGTPMEVNSGGPWLKAFGWVLLILLLLGSIGWWYYQQEASSIGTSTTLQMLGNDSPAVTESDTGTEAQPATADSPADLQAEDPRARLVQPDDVDSADDAAGESNLTGSPTGDAAGSAPEETSASGESTASRDETTPADNTPVDQEADESPAETPAEISTGTQAESAAPAAQQPASSGETGTMLLRFSDASWVEVYNTAEEALLYDLVPAGSTRQVSAAGELRVFLGNAPAVTIEMNGEPFDVQRYVRRDSTARFRVDPTAAQ